MIKEILKKGSKGSNVKIVKKALVKSGFKVKKIDTIFDDSMVKAVMGFQKKSGLVVNGVVDHATFKALSPPIVGSYSSLAIKKAPAKKAPAQKAPAKKAPAKKAPVKGYKK